MVGIYGKHVRLGSTKKSLQTVKIKSNPTVAAEAQYNRKFAQSLRNVQNTFTEHVSIEKVQRKFERVRNFRNLSEHNCV